MTAMGCSVSMSTLLSTYGYSRGDLILAIVAARNSNGWSAVSSQNSGGVKAQTPPTFMNVPIEDPSTSSTSITVTWSPIVTNEQTGALLITSYSLEWQSPSGSSWTALVGLSTPSLALTFTISSGIVAG